MKEESKLQLERSRILAKLNEKLIREKKRQERELEEIRREILKAQEG